MAGVPERVVVTAHVHVSYDRQVGDVRLVGPGSVGRPYEGERGARWAILGPDVELRETQYDHEAPPSAIARAASRRSSSRRRGAAQPITREEIIADAEERVFAG